MPCLFFSFFFGFQNENIVWILASHWTEACVLMAFRLDWGMRLVDALTTKCSSGFSKCKRLAFPCLARVHRCTPECLLTTLPLPSSSFCLFSFYPLSLSLSFWHHLFSLRQLTHFSLRPLPLSSTSFSLSLPFLLYYHPVFVICRHAMPPIHVLFGQTMTSPTLFKRNQSIQMISSLSYVGW